MRMEDAAAARQLAAAEAERAHEALCRRLAEAEATAANLRRERASLLSLLRRAPPATQQPTDGAALRERAAAEDGRGGNAGDASAGPLGSHTRPRARLGGYDAGSGKAATQADASVPHQRRAPAALGEASLRGLPPFPPGSEADPLTHTLAALRARSERLLVQEEEDRRLRPGHGDGGGGFNDSSSDDEYHNAAAGLTWGPAVAGGVGRTGGGVGSSAAAVRFDSGGRRTPSPVGSSSAGGGGMGGGVFGAAGGFPPLAALIRHGGGPSVGGGAHHHPPPLPQE